MTKQLLTEAHLTTVSDWLDLKLKEHKVTLEGYPTLAYFPDSEDRQIRLDDEVLSSPQHNTLIKDLYINLDNSKATFIGNRMIGIEADIRCNVLFNGAVETPFNNADSFTHTFFVALYNGEIVEDYFMTCDDWHRRSTVVND